MEPLVISGLGENPSVNFNGGSGVFAISGKSYPENVNDFYKPVLDYLEQYKASPQTKTILDFNWLYYNTATSKIIVKIIMSLKALKDQNKSVEIIWHCKKSDDLMIEKGEELKEVIDMPFTIELS